MTRVRRRKLKLGFSARSGDAGREAFGLPPLPLMPIEHLTPGMEDRAWEVQMLIAATAEKAGLTVLAVDKDLELIAEITGRPVETLALR